MRSRPARDRVPGTAGESLAGQHGCGSRFEGQAVPGELALAGCAEVAVDLAGDVTLQAADDLLLGQAFPGAPLDVDESRRSEERRVGKVCRSRCGREEYRTELTMT